MTPSTLAITARRSDQTDAWTARYTWRVPESSTHPEHTHSTHGSESAAVDAAVTVLDSQAPDGALRVVRAELRGPGGGWRTVEWTP